jgi:hypothetical protein
MYRLTHHHVTCGFTALCAMCGAGILLVGVVVVLIL